MRVKLSMLSPLNPQAHVLMCGAISLPRMYVSSRESTCLPAVVTASSILESVIARMERDEGRVWYGIRGLENKMLRMRIELLTS